MLPPETLDVAFMFVPSENVYYEVIGRPEPSPMAASSMSHPFRPIPWPPIFRRWRSDFAACGFRKKPSACSRCSRSFLPDSISFRTTSTWWGSTSTTPRASSERDATSNASTRRCRASRSGGSRKYSSSLPSSVPWKPSSLVLYLVHHGDAVGPDVNPMRPLSDRGRVEVDMLAQRAAERGARPDIVWHSGKLRARQTAESYWKRCNPLAEFLGGAWPSTNRPDQLIFDAITGDTRHIMLAGHFPHLPRLLGRLKTGNADAPPVEFPLNGVVALENVEAKWLNVGA